MPGQVDARPAVGGWLRLDEVAGIGAVAELAADEPEPGEGSLDCSARCGVESGESGVACPGMGAFAVAAAC
jgi:hypothetical protein